MSYFLKRKGNFGGKREMLQTACAKGKGMNALREFQGHDSRKKKDVQTRKRRRRQSHEARDRGAEMLQKLTPKGLPVGGGKDR